MINILKKSGQNSVNKKLILLYILNIFDVIFTIILLNTGCFIEANPFMVPYFDIPLIAFLIKAIIPGLLLLYVYLRINNNPKTPLSLCCIILNIPIMFYIGINLLHLFHLSTFLILRFV